MTSHMADTKQHTEDDEIASGTSALRLAWAQQPEPQSGLIPQPGVVKQRDSETYERQSQSPEEPSIPNVAFLQTHLSIAQTLVASVRLWFAIFMKGLPVTIVMIVTMLVYYLPARFMSQDTLEDIRFWVYDGVLHSVMWITSAFGAVIVMICGMFGYNLVKKPLALAFLPLIFLSLLIRGYSLVRSQYFDNFWLDLAGSIVLYSPPFFFFYLVKKINKIDSSEFRNPPSPDLINDGTPQAMSKGYIVVYVNVFFYLFCITSIYTTSSFFWQLVIRVVIYPAICTVSLLFQRHLLLELPEEGNKERALILLSFTIYFQFLGRLLVTTSTFDSNSINFALLNILSGITDIINRATFAHQYGVICFMAELWTEYLRSKKTNIVRNNGSVSQDSNSRLDHFVFSAISDIESNNSPGPRNKIWDRLKFHLTPSNIHIPKKSMDMKLQETIWYMETDIRVLIITPLVMYLLAPIYNDGSAMTFFSFSDLVYQIYVQFLIQLASDLIAFAIQLKCLHIPYTCSLSHTTKYEFLMTVLATWNCLMIVHSNTLYNSEN